MGQPYLGEIRLVGFNFAPVGWAMCDGQLVPIAENDALFNLIGTTYGGDGQETFALPNLMGRMPIHMGQGAGLSNRTIGELGGVETVTLTQNQLPQHNHVPQAQSGSGTQASPAGGVWAASALDQFSSDPPDATMNAQAISSTGGSQPHDNMMPFLTITFVISLLGVYPSAT